MRKGRLRDFLWAQLKDSEFREVVRGSTFVLTARTLAIPFGLLSSLVIARYYGAEIMGVMALISSCLDVLLVFALFGTNIYILKLVPEHRAKYSLYSAGKAYSTVHIVVLINCLVLALVIVPLSGVVAENVFSKEHLTVFLAIAGGLLFLHAADRINMEMLRAIGAIKAYSGMILFSSAGSLTILVAITLYFFHENNPVYLTLVFPVLTLVVTAVLIHRYIKSNANQDMEARNVAILDVYRMSHPMFFTNAMQVVLVYTDVLMLGAMRSESEVGVYSVDARLALLTTFILGSINTVLGPRFSALYYAGNIDGLRNLARKSTALIFWASLPVVIVLIVFGYWILLLFGETFTTGYVALITLCVGRLAASVVGPVGYFLSMTGHAEKIRNTVLFSGILNITLNYVLIPEFGINGAAMASMVSITCNSVVATLYVRRAFGFTFVYLPILARRTSQ